MSGSSLEIILRQYKSGNISEEEAIRLIEDLTSRSNYIPIYPNWPEITYETNPSWKKWEVTCCDIK